MFHLGFHAARRNAPDFLDTFILQFVLPFALDRSQQPVHRSVALRIIEHLDVLEYILPCVSPCRIDFSLNSLAFEALEEALSDSIVMTVDNAISSSRT